MTAAAEARMTKKVDFILIIELKELVKEFLKRVTLSGKGSKTDGDESC